MENREPSIPDLVILSHAYSALGHYRKAQAALRKVLPLAEEVAAPCDRALFFSTLGDLHLLLGDMKGGIKYVKEGLTQARVSENSLIIASLLNNLGNIRAISKNYRGAMKAYQESLAVIGQPARIEEENRSFSLKSKVMINMARTELMRGEYQNAISAVEHAQARIEKQSDASLLMRATLTCMTCFLNWERCSACRQTKRGCNWCLTVPGNCRVASEPMRSDSGRC